jgi:uncharacterized protein
MKRIIRRVLLTVGLLAGLLFWAAIEYVLPYSGIKPFRLNMQQQSWRFPRGADPAAYGMEGQPVSIQTADSLTLKGVYLHAPGTQPRAVFILLHGIGSCKESQLERAERLSQMGFDCLVPDLRAHGSSDGEFCTFGFYEKYDTRAWVDFLQQKNPILPIGIWGVSLGGAIALQTLGLDPRLQFGIIESTFDTFRKVALEYGADYMLGIRSQMLTDHVLAKSAAIAHFDPDQVQPVQSCGQIHVPLLFIHGDEDDKIPIEFNRNNYNAVPDARKQWITVAGANHRNVWGKGGEKLESALKNYLIQLREALPQG